MLAVLVGLIMVIAAIAILATTGFGGSSVSTQLVSTGSEFTSLIPYIGALVASGFVFIAIDYGRSH